MRKVLSILLLAALVAFCQQGLYAEGGKSFSVYADRKSPDNHYIPSGWMGE